MKYIKGHKRKLYLFNRDAQDFVEVTCLTSTDYSQVLEMIEKANTCEKSEKPRSINRSVSFSGEVANDGTGITIDDLYNEQELSRNSVSKWRLQGGQIDFGFDAYLTDVSDSYGDGDATFSGSLAITGGIFKDLIVFEDPEIARILFTNGLISNPTYSTEEELALIKDYDYEVEADHPYDDDYSIFNNINIEFFPEYKYFSGVTEVTIDMFNGATNLKLIEIPSQVTGVGPSAFNRCQSLPSIIIPKKVSIINSEAFSECLALTSITLESTTPPTITARTFDGTVEKFYVPASSVAAYKSATNWSALATKIFPIP